MTTDWRELMASVPRSLFLPDVVWADFGQEPFERVDRTTDPRRWAEVAELDCPLVTQFQDGRAEGEGMATSSASMPAVVRLFLEQLDPYDHHRVLEIGTGTGWTAALLSARVGDGNVTTVEIDAGLSERAGERLEAAGFRPRLVVGDGAHGHADGGPYDRVHATCGVASVPYAWIEQTRPGGVIVAPYSPGFGYGAALRLDVLADGTAIGRFAASADYMLLRAQRPAGGPAKLWQDATDRDVRVSRTLMDPREIRYAPLGLDITIAALVPGVISRCFEDDTGATLWILDRENHGGPWAGVDYEIGHPDFEVHQAGDRNLWDEVEAAYTRWVTLGRPDITRLGLTVTPEHQTIWLDSHDNPLE